MYGTQSSPLSGVPPIPHSRPIVMYGVYIYFRSVPCLHVKPARARILPAPHENCTMTIHPPTHPHPGTRQNPLPSLQFPMVCAGYAHEKN